MKIGNGFTKRQINIMLLLGSLAVLMLCSTLFLRLSDGEPVVAPLPEPHVKLRSARASLSPSFNREINIGGSGDERISDVFVVKDELYIFGSTASDDYDFDGGGGVFLAILSGDGSTKGFFQYGDGGDTLVRAMPCEGGFVLGVNRSDGGAALYVLNGENAVAEVCDISGLGSEKIEDVKLFDEKIIAVTSVVDTANVKNLKARIYDFKLALKAERAFTHVCSLDYIDLFEAGDGNYVIAVNLVSVLINRMAFISWGLAKAPLFYDIDLMTEGGYRCDAVIPRGDGFLAVVVDERKLCDIITVTSAPALNSRVYLKQSSVNGARLFYTPDGYFCFMRRGVEVSTMILLDSDLQYKGVAAQFGSVADVCSHSVYGSSTVFGTRSSRGIQTVTCSGGDLTSSAAFGSPFSDNVFVRRLGGKLFVISEFEKQCGDCPVNFGGSDVWVAALN